ncbi:MAG: hypothetical protein KDE08_05745 [Rhodobacteraceae bacterium]|nr:hypothetical protein [Paracoccaceae bacterium]
MIKVISFFLIGMAVLALFGRLRFPAIMARRKGARCRSCGRPLIGNSPCVCQRGGKA